MPARRTAQAARLAATPQAATRTSPPCVRVALAARVRAATRSTAALLLRPRELGAGATVGGGPAQDARRRATGRGKPARGFSERGTRPGEAMAPRGVRTGTCSLVVRPPSIFHPAPDASAACLSRRAAGSSACRCTRSCWGSALLPECFALAFGCLLLVGSAQRSAVRALRHSRSVEAGSCRWSARERVGLV